MILIRGSLVALVVSIVLVGCGGGGSSASSADTTLNVSAASVGIVLTDSSSDDEAIDEMLDDCQDTSAPEGCEEPVDECTDDSTSEECEEDGNQLLVEVSRVELLGSDSRETIFEGSETIDLFDLKDSLELMFIDDQVSPGTYDKIRFHVDGSPVLINDDYPNGTDVKLPSGKIDFNPRGSFTLNDGDIVTITLDMDANKSLKLTANKKQIILRPVVFVDIDTEEPVEPPVPPELKEGLVRISGVVSSVSQDSSEFILCKADDGSIEPVPLTDDSSEDGHQNRCIEVSVTDKTGLFDDMGEPIIAGDLMEGDPLTVIGLLTRNDDEACESDETSGDCTVAEAAAEDDCEEGAENCEAPDKPAYKIIAIVVQGGLPGTWNRTRGIVESEVDAVEGTFDFALGADGPLVTGQIYEKTRIFAISRETGIREIAAADIVTGDRVIVEAVTVPGDMPVEPEPAAIEGDTLRISIMLVVPAAIEPPLDPLPTALRGTLLSVDSENASLMLATDTGDRCVDVQADALIIQLIVTDDSAGGIKVTLDELVIGARTAVLGTEDTGGCFTAGLVISDVQTRAPDPDPVSPD